MQKEQRPSPRTGRAKKQPGQADESCSAGGKLVSLIAMGRGKERLMGFEAHCGAMLVPWGWKFVQDRIKIQNSRDIRQLSVQYYTHTVMLSWLVTRMIPSCSTWRHHQHEAFGRQSSRTSCHKVFEGSSEILVL